MTVSGRSNLVDVTGEVRQDREKSILFFDGTREVWLPKSQIEIESKGKLVEVTMPEWLAQEKGLI